MFVADYGNERVQAFSATDGAFLFEWKDNSRGCFWNPQGIVIGRDGHLVISDSWLVFVGEQGVV